MTLRRSIPAALLIVLLSPAIATSAAADTKPDPPAGNPQQAIYGDEIINLAEDWSTAQACIELTVETRCYATHAELQEAHADLVGASEGGEFAPRAACGSSLALWDLTGFNPPVVYFNTRNVYHNLSLFGFDRKPSSYQIGACSAVFFDGQGGGGGIYPGSTSAGSSASSMQTGWNNRVRSLYIY